VCIIIKGHQHLSWDSADYSVGRDVFGDDGTCRNHCVWSNVYARQYSGAGADETVVVDDNSAKFDYMTILWLIADEPRGTVVGYESNSCGYSDVFAYADQIGFMAEVWPPFHAATLLELKTLRFIPPYKQFYDYLPNQI